MQRRVFLSLFVVFAGPGLLSAQDQVFVGSWYGAINLPAIDMDVSVTLRQEDGVLAGTIDIPSQEIKAHPISILENGKDKISFNIPNMPGTPTFNGTLSQDSRYIFGEFTQGTHKYNFRLIRSTTFI